jgi:hypothetical protein
MPGCSIGQMPSCSIEQTLDCLIAKKNERLIEQESDYSFSFRHSRKVLLTVEGVGFLRPMTSFDCHQTVLHLRER